MFYLSFKDNSNIKTNLFLTTHDIESDIITICFDDITKGTTIFKQVSKSDFINKFEIIG